MRCLKLLAFSLVLLPNLALGAITFDSSGKWSSTFNCDDWTHQGGINPSCDGISSGLDGMTSAGSSDQITSAANNPSGGGGRGFRHWQGDGTNNNGGGVTLSMPSPQTELWVRWYHRYEEGFSWSSLDYDKVLYIFTGNGGTQIIPEYVWGVDGTYALIAQGTSDYYQVTTGDYGWSEVQGGLTGSGNFDAFEIYIKMDTDQTNGIGRLWVNGVLRAENIQVDWSNGLSVAQAGWVDILVGSNQKTPNNGRDMAVDYDDIVIYNQTPPNVDASGNAFIGPIGWDGGTPPAPTCSDGIQNGDETGVDCGGSCSACETGGPVDPVTGLVKGTQLMSESFENDSWSTRGWYDGTDSTGTATGGYSGNALNWTWTTTSTRPTGFSSLRQVLDSPVDEFLIEYYVKYDTGWQGSGQAYHPHLLHILSSDDTAYQGFSGSNSNLYFESLVSGGVNYPLIAHQDLVRAVSATNDLTGVTETRSANHCDTPYALTGATSGTCYASDSDWYSANTWRSQTITIPSNEWTKITAHIKMNSFDTGVGQFDGIMKLWVNDDLAIESNTVLYAAGAYEGATWNKLALAPWIGDGSPANQTMWIDELNVWAVASSPPPTGTGRIKYNPAARARWTESGGKRFVAAP